jgi:hypothetical protein
MPLQATSGAASYDGFGGGAPFTPTYIEDVFSTWLYTGNGSTQTINNGIDLAGKGGMFWGKNRGDALRHWLIDSSRAGRVLYSNLTDAEGSGFGSTSPFTSTGLAFTSTNAIYNGSANTYVGWTFRKQPKFFDVVTYTGNGTARTIAHNLGSVPGCIIVKSMTDAVNWNVYHRSVGSGSRLILNTTDAALSAATTWNNTDPTSTQFTVGTSSQINFSGSQYVAYLFAHDAGGFGLTGTDNVISCGSFTTDSGGTASVTLGYEPQWVLLKKTSSGAEDWYLFDNMRGIPTGSADAQLNPNLSAAESSSFNYINLTATGFGVLNQSSSATYIYIAIRRGPMKTPTSGTSVFSPVTREGSGTTTTITTPGFAPDALFSSRTRNSGGYYVFGTVDKLRGRVGLEMTATDAESAFGSGADLTGWSNVGYGLGPSSGSNLNNSGLNYIDWVVQRAPGFFDVVCYTGTGTNTTQAHNLGVAPELMIVKRRNDVENWYVYHSALGATKRLKLNLTDAEQTALFPWNNTAPTSTVFSLANSVTGNGAGDTYVWYGFSTVAGVSKVGSYTGNGSSQTLDMGFTGGARFFLVKRTDSTGDWWVYDSARGIVAANDPALRLNSTAAEVTSADAVDTASVGLIVNQESTCNINVNGATYVYLGIA